MYADALAGYMNTYAAAIEMAVDTEDGRTRLAIIRHIAGELKAHADAAANVGYEPDHYTYGETTMITDHLDTCPVEYTDEHAEFVEKLAQIILGYN